MRSGKCLLLCVLCFMAFGLMGFPAPISLGNQAHAQVAESFATDESTPVVVFDPHERFNRAMFNLNDKLYFYAIKPVGIVYAAYFPPGLRNAVRNGFYNVIFPGRFINCILQGKGERSGIETLRFVINSTLGLGGLIDYADYGFGITKPPEEDFGQTLAVWGVGNGPYLIIPALGPSNMRDFGGYLVDGAMDPTFWIPATLWTGPVIRAGKLMNNASLRIGEYEDFKKSALDPYVSLRSAYQQYRIKEIAR